MSATPNARDQANQLWQPVTASGGSTILLSRYADPHLGNHLALSVLGGNATQGAALSVEPEAGASTQRWALPSSNAIQVGSQRFPTFAFPGQSGFEVIGLDSAGRPEPRTPAVFHLAGATGLDDAELHLMDTLLDTLSNEHALVVIQSIGHPKPTSPRWADVPNDVASLGGTREVFNGLDGSGGYALIGCRGCTGEEASPSLTGVSTSDEAHGLLNRNAASRFIPLLGDPGTTANPTLDYSLIPIAYGQPQPWPVPGGVTASANAAVLNYIATRVELTAPACYQHPAGQADVRSAFCNIYEDWGIKLTQVTQLAPPGPGDCSSTAPLPGQGFSNHDFCLVRNQLEGEIADLGTVKSFIGGTKSLIQSSEALINAKIKAESDVILAKTLPPASRDASGTMSELAAAALGLVGEVAPEPIGAALGATSELIYIGAAISSFGGGSDAGSLTPETFHARADQFAVVEGERLQAAVSALGKVFDLLAQDPVKLRTVAAYVDGPYAIVQKQQDAFNARLQQGVRASLYMNLLPAYFTVLKLPALPNGHRLQDITCDYQFGKFLNHFSPFAREPDSATFTPVTGIDSTGRQIRSQIWALGHGTNYNVHNGGFSTPTAELTDPLFDAPPSGIGFTKTFFFTQTTFEGSKDFGRTPPCYTPAGARAPSFTG